MAIGAAVAAPVSCGSAASVYDRRRDRIARAHHGRNSSHRLLRNCRAKQMFDAVLAGAGAKTNARIGRDATCRTNASFAEPRGSSGRDRFAHPAWLRLLFHVATGAKCSHTLATGYDAGPEGCY